MRGRARQGRSGCLSPAALASGQVAGMNSRAATGKKFRMGSGLGAVETIAQLVGSAESSRRTCATQGASRRLDAPYELGGGNENHAFSPNFSARKLRIASAGLTGS